MYYRDKEDHDTPGSVLVDVWRKEPGVIVFEPGDALHGIPIRWYCSACDLHGEFVIVAPPIPEGLLENDGFLMTSSENVHEDALDIHDMTDVIGADSCPGGDITIISTDANEARLISPEELHDLANKQ